MILDPRESAPLDFYHAMIGAVAPRPIAWVSTVNAAGLPNLAPFSFFTGAGVNPPVLCFAPMNRPDGTGKDTLRNLEEVPEFVVNAATFPLAGAMNATSADWPPETGEFDAAGLERRASVRVRPPRVAASPVQFECRVLQIVPLGDGPWAGRLVIGEVLLAEISDAVLDSRGRIDPGRLDLIGRLGGSAYVRTNEPFEIKRPEAPPRPERG